MEFMDDDQLKRLQKIRERLIEANNGLASFRDKLAKHRAKQLEIIANSHVEEEQGKREKYIEDGDIQDLKNKLDKSEDSKDFLEDL